MVNSWILYQNLDGKNISLISFVRGIALESLGIYGRTRQAQTLSVSAIAGNSIRVDTSNHLLMKGTLKYCRYKLCGRRAIYASAKNATLVCT